MLPLSADETPTTAVSIYEPKTVDQSMWLAKTIAESGMAPAGLDTPQKILVAMMHGSALGLNAMQSIQNIHVIKSKPTLSADLMGAVVRQSQACLYLRETVATPERVTMTTARTDDPEHEFSRTWTLEDAKRAGLANSSTWRSYPRQMLRARCLSEICRAVFPEVVGGFYVPHELDASRPPEPQIASTPEAAAKPTPKPAAVAVVVDVVAELVEPATPEPVPDPALDEAKAAQAAILAAEQLTIERIQHTRAASVPVYHRAHPMLAHLLAALCDLAERDPQNTEHLARFKLLDRTKPLETENCEKLTGPEWLELLNVPKIKRGRLPGVTDDLLHLRAASAYARLVLETWAWRYECARPFDDVSAALSSVSSGKQLIAYVAAVVDMPDHHWRDRFVEIVRNLLGNVAPEISADVAEERHAELDAEARKAGARDADDDAERPELWSARALEVYHRAIDATTMTDDGRAALRAALAKVPDELMDTAERMALGLEIGLLIRSTDPASAVRKMSTSYRERANAESAERRRQRST